MNNSALIKFLVGQCELAKPTEERHTKRKMVPHRIKFKGQFIKTCTGKSLWPSLGAAKNALNLEIQSQLSMQLYFGLGKFNTATYVPIIQATKDKLNPVTYEEREEIEQAFKEAFMEFVEFVPIE